MTDLQASMGQPILPEADRVAIVPTEGLTCAYRPSLMMAIKIAFSEAFQ